MKAIYYMTLEFPLFQVKVEVSYPNENIHQFMYRVTEVPSPTYKKIIKSACFSVVISTLYKSH